jgi:predicted nucleotidyltransferase
MTHNARVDEATYLLYATVAEAAKVHGMQWMVTGAGSRILLLENVYGLPRGKATEDVDFAVMVESWEHYQTIVARICEDERFTRDPRQRQRIRGPIV